MGLQIRAEAADRNTLASYNLAALRFIDPELTADSPLADVHTAALSRRQQLLELPIAKSREDLQALDEALNFVRQYRLGDTQTEHPATAAPIEVVDPPPAPEPAAELDPGPEAAATAGEGDAVAPAVSVPQAAPARPARGRSLRDAMTGARPADAILRTAPAEQAPPAPIAEHEVPLLAEVRAWPVLLGLLLILWQCWLALFAGWTCARFLLWPGPGIELQLNWLLLGGVVVVGTVAAAATGTLVWRYRQRTGHLLMLVHLTAGFIALDLAAWRLAAGNPGLLIDPPRGWYWLLLAAGWLIAVVAAWVHDLRVGEWELASR